MNCREDVFTTHLFHVKLPSLASQLYITPFGDVHFKSPDCDLPRFNEFLAEAKASHIPGQSFYLDMGDETDAVSRSEREILLSARLHDSTLTQLDEAAISRNKAYMDKIAFMKGSMIGRVQGNHFWSFLGSDKEEKVAHGMTSSEWICQQMECQWLGYLSYIRINVTFQNTTKHASLDIVACHGKAGGKLVGTSINQVDDLRKVFPVASIYIMGHDHQRGGGGWPVSVLRVDQRDGALRVKEQQQFLARSGSFLKSYEPGKQNDAVGRLYKPSSLGAIKFIVQFQRKVIGGRELLAPKINCLE